MPLQKAAGSLVLASDRGDALMASIRKNRKNRPKEPEPQESSRTASTSDLPDGPDEDLTEEEIKAMTAYFRRNLRANVARSRARLKEIYEARAREMGLPNWNFEEERRRRLEKRKPAEKE